MRPRPERAGPGQESVWDYPRPPACVPSRARVQVRAGAVVIADSDRAYRVLETSHPPGWYLPAADVRGLRLSAAPGTFCEWKGRATYWDVITGADVLAGVAWSYESPSAGFTAIAGYVSFMPAALDCRVNGVRAGAQAGGFYGGWITPDVVGPFKGAAGTWGW